MFPNVLVQPRTPTLEAALLETPSGLFLGCYISTISDRNAASPFGLSSLKSPPSLSLQQHWQLSLGGSWKPEASPSFIIQICFQYQRGLEDTV